MQEDGQEDFPSNANTIAVHCYISKLGSSGYNSGRQGMCVFLRGKSDSNDLYTYLHRRRSTSWEKTTWRMGLTATTSGAPTWHRSAWPTDTRRCATSSGSWWRPSRRSRAVRRECSEHLSNLVVVRCLAVHRHSVSNPLTTPESHNAPNTQEMARSLVTSGTVTGS